MSIDIYIDYLCVYRCYIYLYRLLYYLYRIRYCLYRNFGFSWWSDSSHQDYPITILKPICLQQQVIQETIEEQGIQYYNELIIAIMKVMNVNNVTHCINDNYRLITIQGAVSWIWYIYYSFILFYSIFFS